MIGHNIAENDVCLNRRDSLSDRQMAIVENFTHDAEAFFQEKIDNCDEYETTMRQMQTWQTLRDYCKSLHGEGFELYTQQLESRKGNADIVHKDDYFGFSGVLSNRPDFVNVIPIDVEDSTEDKEERLLNNESLALSLLVAALLPIHSAGSHVGVTQEVKSDEYAYPNIEFLPYAYNSVYQKLKTVDNYLKFLNFMVTCEFTFSTCPDVVVNTLGKCHTLVSKSVTAAGVPSLKAEVYFTRLKRNSIKEDEFYCSLNPPVMQNKPVEHVEITKEFLHWAQSRDLASAAA